MINSQNKLKIFQKKKEGLSFSRFEIKYVLSKELSKIIYTSEIAKQRNMRVNAGHDLDLINLPYLIETNLIDEVSIGHAIISESLNQGFKKTINQYIKLING